MTFSVTFTFIILLVGLSNVNGQYGEMYEYSDASNDIGVSTQTSGGGLLDFEVLDDVENSSPNAGYIYKQEVTSQNDFKEEVSSDVESKIVGGKYDSLFEEAQKKDPTLPDEENRYTVYDFEQDSKIEVDFEAITKAELIEFPVFVERLNPKERTINMQFNDFKIYNLTIKNETDDVPMDSNATDDVFVDPDKKISPTVDLPTVELKDARYCDGHLVQNNQISWSPAIQCPDNMMKKPMGLKIKCKSIHRCTLEDCCVAKCTSDVCTDANAPYAIYEKVCSSLQGETLSDPSKCSARQCCTDKPSNCKQYLATNKCSEGRVPQYSEEFFGTGVTDYENQCCPFVSNCKVFDEKYGCPANLELHIFPESIPCYGIAEDTCDIVDCCSPISVPDYEQGWAYYENNGESDDVEEPYYHAEFVGHFLYEADQLVMYNVTPGTEQRARIENCRTACAYQNPNTIQGGEWSTFGQATGFVMINRYKCICQKIQEHADFVVPPLRQKFTYTNQLDVIEHLIKYNSVMFETYTLAPVRVHDYRFDAVFLNTFGKCSLPIYLDGHLDMAPKLPSSDPLYNADGKIECMNRCLAEYPEVRGFFISHSDQSCACANNKCENINHHNSYRAYEIVPAKIEPSCPLFPVPRNDYKKPEHAVYCKNCTDLKAETKCDEWVYITPDSNDSDFDIDESWSCPNFENENATCTKCKGTTCLEISCNIGFSNENGIIEDGCETRCNDECQICDTYNASKCVQRFCESGQRPVNSYIDGSHACESCPSGQYGTGTTCIHCQAGTYQDEQAQSECKNCAIGRYSQYQGMVSPCKVCPPKTTTEQTGSDAQDKCVGCPSGHELRNNVCTVCEAGKVEIDSVCRICARGYTSLPGTSRACVTCSQGKSIHGTECIDCPVGRFKGGGQTECEACPQGWFQSEERSTECQICPENTLSFYEASSTCYCVGNTQNCDSPIKLLSKERVLEKVHKLLYSNTGLIQPFLDILGTKCLEDIRRNHENCNECSNPFNSNLKCLQTSSGPVQDTDDDGYMDYVDAFPEDSTEWKDSDGDGVGDNTDAFPYDPTRWIDSDGDGYGDEEDDLPHDPTEWIDSDRDGVGDNSDEFPNDPLEWTDTDGDGVGDNSDEFPNDPSEWTDTDNDGLGDNEDDPHPNDSDNDGFTNLIDPFPLDPTEWADSDNDGVGDQEDDPHPGDTDNDGVPNPIGFDPFDASANQGKTWHDQPGVDHFPTDYNYQTDTDGDGIDDKIDPDKDGDNHANEVDAFPMDPTEWSDMDGDGIGDNSDTDVDGDGHAQGADYFTSGTCADRNMFQIRTKKDCETAAVSLGKAVWTRTAAPLYESKDFTALGFNRPTCFMWNNRIYHNTNANPYPTGTSTIKIVCTTSDAFPNDPSEHADMDHDGIGDNSDTDKDGDGVANGADAFPNDANEHVDLDGDGIGDNSDPDRDGDGVTNGADAFPNDPNESADLDGDGIGDNSDPDRDGDGVTNGADAFPNDATRAADTDGDGTADWRIVNGEKVIEDWMPNDASGTQDSDMDGVADSADTYTNDPRRKIDVRAGLTPVSYSYDVASNSGTSTQSVGADTEYFLISSGTCGSHGGVQVTVQADCQTARDELGLTSFHTGSYAVGSRPNCFVYTSDPEKVYYNTNTGSTDTPKVVPSWTAQVVCKKVGLSYTPQHMAAQVFEASLTANVDGYVAELVGNKACNYAESAVVKPTVPLNTGTRAQQVTNCKNACADTTQWGTSIDPEGMPEYELAYVDGYPTHYKYRADGSTDALNPSELYNGQLPATREEMVSNCAKACFHANPPSTNPPTKIKGFFVLFAHSSLTGRCHCSFKHSTEDTKTTSTNSYVSYDFKTDTDLMNSEDKIRGFFLHKGIGNAALKGQCVCIKQDPYKNVESGHECLSQYDTYAIRGEECEKTSRPEYESVWEEVTGYCSSASSSGAMNFEACEKLCFDAETCLSFSYEHDESRTCRLPPPNYKCTGSNLLDNTAPWKTYNKRSAANQRFLSDNMPPVCLTNINSVWDGNTYTGCDGARWSGGSFAQEYCDGTSLNMQASSQQYSGSWIDSKKEFYEKCCDWTGSACVNKWDNRFYDASTQKYNRVKSNSKCRRVFKWTKPHGDDAMCYDQGSSLRVYSADSNDCPAGDRECHVVKCAAKCFSGEYGASGTADLLRYGDNGFNDIMKGFGVDHKNGICECTTYGQMPCGSELEDGSSTELATDSFTATLYKKDHYCANYDDYYNVGEDYAKAVESCKEICGHEGEKGFFIHQTRTTGQYDCACSTDTCVSALPSNCCDSYHIDEKKLTGYEFMYECPEDDTEKLTNSKLLENRGRCTNKAEVYKTNSLGTCNEVQAGSCESKAYECAKTCAAYHWVETNKLQSNTNGVTFYSDLYVVPWETSCPIGSICNRMKGRMLPGGSYTSTSSEMNPMRVSKDEYVFGVVHSGYMKMVSVIFDQQTRQFELSLSKYATSSTVSSLSALTNAKWRAASKQGGGGTCGTNQYCAGDFYLTNENLCTCRQRVAGSSLTCTNNNDVNALTVKTHMTKTVADSQTINAEYNALTLTKAPFTGSMTCDQNYDGISMIDSARILIQPQRYKSLTMYLKHADYDAGNCNSNTECEKTQCAKQCYSGEYGPYGQYPKNSDPRISTLYTKVYSGGYITNHHKYYESSSLKNANAKEFRMYAGCGFTDGPTNTYPDGTTDCDASPEKRVDECAAACYSYVYSNGFKMQGFMVRPLSGRCYCSIPRGESTQYTPQPAFTTDAVYDHYDFNRIYGELQRGWPNVHIYDEWGSTDWRIFEGSSSETYPDGTTIGSAAMEQRIEECARGCFARGRLTSIDDSFKNVNGNHLPATAKGFLVIPSSGRCYCSYVGNMRGTTTQTYVYGYFMGNFIRDTLPNFGRGKMKAIDYNPSTGQCSCKSENSAHCASRVDNDPDLLIRYIRTGECNTGSEVYVGQATGANNDEKAQKCARLCRSSYITWEGFIVGGSNNNCYCESAASATCGTDDDHYRRYDFMGTKVTSASKMKNTGATWYDINFQSKKLGSKHLMSN